MLYTCKGDTGTSGLLGTTKRFPKNSSVYDALGTLDELNSLLGFCRAVSLRSKQKRKFNISKEILKAQQCLFIIQAELAGAHKSIMKVHIRELEQAVDALEKMIQNPHSFVIPGATELSGLFDYARAVSRRAERAVWEAHTIRNISSETRAYLNRLSSLLYALARYAAKKAAVKEVSPSY